MYTRGIRGATTVNIDTPEAIKKATIELFDEIINVNEINYEDISHIIFTMTSDLKSAYPAKFVREHFNLKYVPLACMNELEIENSLKKCIRILIVVNTNKSQSEIKHIYLAGAKTLRKDLQEN